MSATTPPEKAARPRSRRLRVAVATALVLALVVLLAGAWALSDRALAFALDYAVKQSAGRLSYDGASGSLLGRVAVDRIAWHDGPTRVAAEGVELVVSPRALLEWRVVVSRIGARHIAVELPEGDGGDTALPESLALPLSVTIHSVRVGRIDWKSGGSTGTIDALAFGYAGDATGHRVRDIDVRMQGARLAGEAELAAASPFATRGRITLDLATPYPQGRVEAALDGSLAALQIGARGMIEDVAGEAQVRLAPLAAQPLVEARASAGAVDIARFSKGWPKTRVDVTALVNPAPGGYAGSFEARNALPGAIDASRLPLASLAGKGTLAGDTLTLDGLSARLANGGTAAGGGTIDLRSGASRWQLTVRDLDLAAMHGSLVPTRLAGTLEADVKEAVQVVRGDVRQQDLRLAFDARYDGREVVATKLVAEARGGEATGTGRIALDAQKTFAIDARTRRFDPSRFGDFPAGTLDGTVMARGTLAPLAIETDVAAAAGSRLAGLPLQGSARVRLSREALASIAVDVTLGATRLRAEGGYGKPGDRLALDVRSRRLEELAPLLRAAPGSIAGSVDARMNVESRARGAHIAVDARADRLALGPEYAFGTLRAEGNADFAPPLVPPRIDAITDITLEISTTGAAAAHTLALDATTPQGRIEGRVAGALALPASGVEWRGRVEALAARDVPGFAPLSLAEPVTVDVATDRLVVGPARIEGGGLRAEVDLFEWRGGAVASRGRFRGLPIAPIAKQSGLETRWPMDLVLNGEWDIAASPDWRGTLRVARESGDIYVDDPGGDGTRRIALGVEALAIDARLEGARATGTAEFRAKLAGNALADFAIEAPQGASHPFSAAAPVRGTVRAHLPSLASLQPWLGATARVQGQAIGDVAIAGTLGAPAFTGQLVAYGLRLDMPQYGVAWRDGEMRIASGPEGLALEKFEIGGGEGRFTASGAIVLPRAGGAAAEGSRITWRAENFRALNRPDMRVVVDGEGTLAAVGKKLVLKGELKADEGNFEYRSASETTLADDIVVVGRPRRVQQKSEEVAIGDTPLEVDLALDLGRDLHFSAEGLDTRLAGRLRVTTRSGGVLEGRGTIRTVRGTYWAFGQKLDIDRGRVIFDGPLANPSLDVVALRKNLPVEAGVEITGTVRAPVVRLTSNPPVPDSEKLSWLLTGGPSGSSSAKEAAALSAATAALVGRGGKSLTQSVAQSIGLDEISLSQRTSGTGTQSLEGEVLTVGKRINDRLYVAYEQGLTIATNALRLEYILSRYFTVSAFTGTSSGVALSFRRNWR